MSCEEEFSSAFAQQLRLESTCEISDLSDVDLAEIFKRLPPFDRLLISEVCKRWYRICRKAWLDITELDVSPIPGPNIAAIVKRCPDLRVISAVDKTIGPKALWGLSSCASMSSLKLYDCTVQDAEEDSDSGDQLALFWDKFYDRRKHVADVDFDSVHPLELLWKNATQFKFKELVLHNVNVFAGEPFDLFIAVKLPKGLDRLQLSGPAMDTHLAAGMLYLPYCLEPLQNLTCLILNMSTLDLDLCEWISTASKLDGAGTLEGLKQLRELCLGLRECEALEVTMPELLELPMDLPRLEVLLLNNVMFGFGSEDDLSRLATKHPTLRVLMLTGSFTIDEECTIATRPLYPNWFAQEPLPLLHIFLGKQASERIRFRESLADVLKIYPISTPLPSFLENAEIAPIFEGVWIAEQIKEGVRFGAEWWDYAQDVTTSFRCAA